MGAIVGEMKSLNTRLLDVWVFFKQGVGVLGVSENVGKVKVFNDSEGAMKDGNGCTAVRPSFSNRVTMT